MPQIDYHVAPLAPLLCGRPVPLGLTHGVYMRYLFGSGNKAVAFCHDEQTAHKWSVTC